VSFATLLAISFSASFVASNPVTLVNVSTGIENASQKLMKSVAFLHPSTVRTASKLSAFPSASYTLERFATAPTVIPFRRINPVTISFA